MSLKGGKNKFWVKKVLINDHFYEKNFKTGAYNYDLKYDRL